MPSGFFVGYDGVVDTWVPIAAAPVPEDGSVLALRAASAQPNPASLGGSIAVQAELPGPPRNLTAAVKAPGGTIIRLAWESGTATDAYELWRGAAPDFAQAELLASNLVATLAYADDLTCAGVTYTYWVRGRNATGLGALSEPVSATQTNQLWAVRHRDPFPGVPLVAEDGDVFLPLELGTGIGNLACYSATGDRRWSLRFTPEILPDPVLGPTGNLMLYAESVGIIVLTPSGAVRAQWKRSLALNGWPTDLPVSWPASKDCAREFFRALAP